MNLKPTARVNSFVPAVFSTLFLVASAQAFELKSESVKPNAALSEDFVFDSFGCSGKNLSPELHWTGAPKGTKSFAVTVYDPDAPTGSGFWHWVAVDLPAATTSLKAGTKSADLAPGAAVTNDYGVAEYGGPCPPPGKPHHYIFTVYALKTEKLGAPAGATNAVVRFFIHGAMIGKASFTATYGRKP